MNVIVIYSATNNDTYETKEFSLQHCINPDDEENPQFKIVFDENDLTSWPHGFIKESVKSTYDGVWEPDMDSIKVYEVKEIGV